MKDFAVAMTGIVIVGLLIVLCILYTFPKAKPPEKDPIAVELQNERIEAMQEAAADERAVKHAKKLKEVASIEADTNRINAKTQAAVNAMIENSVRDKSLLKQSTSGVWTYGPVYSSSSTTGSAWVNQTARCGTANGYTHCVEVDGPIANGSSGN